MKLSTTYMGLQLKNPIVVAASPLSKTVDSVKQLEDAGAAAVVMYSLFEEQINHEQRELDHFLTQGTDSFAEALSYFPEPEEFANLHAEEYLEHIGKLKSAVDIPIIPSLNGVSTGGWTSYAQKLQAAGADALELNIYYVPTNPKLTAQDVEQMYLDTLKAVKGVVSIPVALKVGPFMSAFANFAQQVDRAGVDGLVLFNRFFGPDIDLDTLEVVSKLTLSKPTELQLPLRWIAILHDNIKADLAATSGIYSASDVIKSLMAGASIAQVAGVVLQRGIEYLGTMLTEMEQWLGEHDYESAEQLIGSLSYRAVAEPAAYERANYMKMLQSYN